MPRYRVEVTVTFSATDDVEVDAENEEDAKEKAADDHGISLSDLEEDYVQIGEVTLIDSDEDEEEEEPPSSAMPVTRDQAIIPGMELLLVNFKWAQ